jgi:hypothetical protein
MYSMLTFLYLLHIDCGWKISLQKNYDNTPCEFLTGMHKAEGVTENLSQTRVSERTS